MQRALFLMLMGFCSLRKGEGQNCSDGIDIALYHGNNSLTDGGRTCQRWSLQTPHSHEYTTDKYFPLDNSLDNAANYCRNHGSMMPWCLTNDPHVRWGSCYARICGDNGSWCGGIQTTSQGWLVAEDRISDCLWTLVAPHDKIIGIEIKTLRNLESYTCNDGFGFVEIYEEHFSHGRYCSDKRTKLTSLSNTLYVRLYLFYIGAGGGFKANYSHVEAPKSNETVPLEKFPVMVSGSLTCPPGTDLNEYAGYVSVTNTGRRCQRWTDHPPHFNTYIVLHEFERTDGSITNASNYCRNILDYRVPWCFISDPYLRWDSCDESICAAGTENTNNTLPSVIYVHQMNETQELIHSTEAAVSSTAFTTKNNTGTDEQKSGAVTPIVAGVGGTVIFLLGLVMVVVFTSNRSKKEKQEKEPNEDKPHSLSGLDQHPINRSIEA